jgi:hypothetical protein
MIAAMLREPRRMREAAKIERGNMRYVLLWVLGIPIPVLILIWLLFGH